MRYKIKEFTWYINTLLSNRGEIVQSTGNMAQYTNYHITFFKSSTTCVMKLDILAVFSALYKFCLVFKLYICMVYDIFDVLFISSCLL